MHQKINAAPFFLQRCKHRIHRGNVFHVAGQQKIRTNRSGQRFYPLAQSFALIGECQLRALIMQRLSNAPRNGMTIGHAHNQAAFALHQACRAFNRACAVCVHNCVHRAHASICLKNSVALVPPKPNEFDRTVPSFTLSMRFCTIFISAKAGSSSSIWALAAMKLCFIISKE